MSLDNEHQTIEMLVLALLVDCGASKDASPPLRAGYPTICAFEKTLLKVKKVCKMDYAIILAWRCFWENGTLF